MNKDKFPLQYKPATLDMIDSIFDILHISIKTVYPKYYIKEVVDFFYERYSKEHIKEKIESGGMGVLIVNDKIVATGCYDQNHITGVYVHPDFQKLGYGTFIMDTLENIIAKNYKSAVLDASLCAIFMYEKRGYKTISHGLFELEKDVKFIYEIMEKILK